MIDFSQTDGVIFDLDGTLVESRLDFSAIRAYLGCPDNEDILTFIDQLPEAHQRSEAQEYVLNQELTDALGARWLKTGRALVEASQAEGVPMAIVTRNCRQATLQKVQNNQIPISYIVTREDAPPKPDPTALLQVAQAWGITPARCLYVGDFDYDRMAAERAGMPFLLV